MSKFTVEQNEQYYRVRLDPFRLRHSKGMEHRSRCPVHGGSNATQFWVDFVEGNFCCFSCGAKGPSAYILEQQLLKSELGRPPLHDEVMSSLEAVLGTPFVQRTYPEPLEKSKRGWNRKQARDFYRYTDEIGDELFTVWRFVDREGRKLTPADRPCPCYENPEAECAFGCTDGRVWSTKGVRRVLYRLPDVIASSVVFVVEGEKNANDLSRALALYIRQKGGFPLGAMTLDRVAVTTNPGGAAAWKREYGFGRYFTGKVVIKLGDNDEPGRLHDRDACNDIAAHALKTFTLGLPVGEGEDISDYLAEHDVEDLLRLLPSRKEWTAPQRKEAIVAESLEPRTLLVKPSELIGSAENSEGDWLVQGLIERGTRGLVVAPPKTGKSLLFLELVLCLSTRQGFLGARAYHRPIKCAVISREDGPRMVYRRLKQLAAGHGIDPREIDRNLLVNTIEQSDRFKIDRPEDIAEMADWLKMMGIEFCVIDVLNRLHDQQENSSDDMTKVMQRFDELAARSGAQICVIHHTNKAGGVKGSTSIEGWADYIVRLEQNLDDDAVKTLYLKTKSTGSAVPRNIRYFQSDDQTVSRIALVQRRADAA
jgi:KaiC/GvpD/RAD55 family RecA-like ATPase